MIQLPDFTDQEHARRIQKIGFSVCGPSISRLTPDGRHACQADLEKEMTAARAQARAAKVAEETAMEALSVGLPRDQPWNKNKKNTTSANIAPPMICQVLRRIFNKKDKKASWSLLFSLQRLLPGFYSSECRHHVSRG